MLMVSVTIVMVLMVKRMMMMLMMARLAKVLALLSIKHGISSLTVNLTAIESRRMFLV